MSPLSEDDLRRWRARADDEDVRHVIEILAALDQLLRQLEVVLERIIRS